MLALVLQPDAASLAALAASGTLGWFHRSAWFALVAITAAVLASAVFNASSLEPQPFVESVLSHAARHGILLAVGLIVLLAAAVWLLIVNGPIRSVGGLPLAGLLLGFSGMAMLGSFPYPRIGYGAAPIFGFGLALGDIPPRNQQHAG